jgi:hypothetical protein
MRKKLKRKRFNEIPRESAAGQAGTKIFPEFNSRLARLVTDALNPAMIDPNDFAFRCRGAWNAPL